MFLEAPPPVRIPIKLLVEALERLLERLNTDAKPCFQRNLYLRITRCTVAAENHVNHLLATAACKSLEACSVKSTPLQETSMRNQRLFLILLAQSGLQQMRKGHLFASAMEDGGKLKSLSRVRK
jgi:hypothetical protein